MNETIKLIQKIKQEIKNSELAIQEIEEQNPQLKVATPQQINAIANITGSINEVQRTHSASIQRALLLEIMNIEDQKKNQQKI